MTFKTLMKIRNIITSQMLELDAQIEELQQDAQQIKDESGSCWIIENSPSFNAYELNRRYHKKAIDKRKELEEILTEIENAELR